MIWLALSVGCGIIINIITCLSTLGLIWRLLCSLSGYRVQDTSNDIGNEVPCRRVVDVDLAEVNSTDRDVYCWYTAVANAVVVTLVASGWLRDHTSGRLDPSLRHRWSCRLLLNRIWHSRACPRILWALLVFLGIVGNLVESLDPP